MTDWRTIRQLHSRRQRRPAQSLALAAALVLLALTLAACSGGSSDPVPPAEGQPTSDGPLSPPAQPLRPEDVPFEIIGPLDARNALTRDQVDRFGVFVLDVPNESIYIIQSPKFASSEGIPFVRSARWVDEESLHVETLVSTNAGGLQRNQPGPAYLVRLNGDVFSDQRDPPRQTELPSMVTSADGDWYARKEDGSFGAILVGRTGEAPSYRLTNGWTDVWIGWHPTWSPQGSTLAFTGNICLGMDLFLFDPEEVQLRVLSELGEGNQNFNNFVWQPDGRTLAVNLFPEFLSDRPGAIGLIDVDTGAVQRVAELNTSGWLEPQAWSPSGDLLLIRYIGGGSLCVEVGLEGVPTPETTALEILRD